jgi:hypothetical protein
MIPTGQFIVKKSDAMVLLGPDQALVRIVRNKLDPSKQCGFFGKFHFQPNAQIRSETHLDPDQAFLPRPAC